MIKERLYETKFYGINDKVVSDYCNTIMPYKIDCPTYTDAYLVSTFRGLLYDKVKENGTFSLLSLDPSTPRQDLWKDNALSICFRSDNIDNYEIPEGYTNVLAVERFLQNTAKVKCFVNGARKSTVILVEGYDQVTIASLNIAISCSSYPIIPYYLTYEKGDAENPGYRIANALNKGNAMEFMDIIDELYEKSRAKFDFFSKRIESFERGSCERNLLKYQDKVKDLQRKIEELLRDLEEKSKKIDELNVMIEHERGKSFESILSNYLMASDVIDVIGVYPKKVIIEVKGYLEYFDERAARGFLANSSLLKTDNEVDEPELMKRLLKEIYIDGKYKLRVSYGYEIDDELSYEAIAHVNEKSEETYIQNPHLKYYDCIGQNAQALSQYKRQGDFIGFFEQLTYITRNINFSDSAVMRRLIEELEITSCKCIEDEQGNLMTPKELMKGFKNGISD